MRVLRTLNGADGEGLSVLLLGNDRPTVPVAAALHRMNYRVIVTRDCGKGYAQFSRHVSETWDHPPIEADAMFFSALGKFLRSRPDIRVVLPLWERCVTNLARHRHLLPADRLYACVDDDTMETCLDKSKMLSLAMECGMANAAFTKVGTYPSLIKATRAIGFPLVVRPTDPNRKLAGKKALIADNAKDLISMLPIWPDGHKDLIVQRYIDGRRINLYFAAQNGKAIRYLTTEILRTDELDAAQFDIPTRLATKRLEDAVGLTRTRRGAGCIRRRVPGLLLLRGDADKHIPCGTEVLHRGIAEAALIECRTDLRQLHRVIEAHLDQCTAGEIQTEIQPPNNDGKQADHQQGTGEDHRLVALPHEIQVATLPKLKLHDPLPNQMASLRTRRPP